MEEIRNFNLQKSTTTKSTKHSVSDFLNEPSPIKSNNNKRPADVHEVDSSNKNDSIDSIGSGSQVKCSNLQQKSDTPKSST